MGWIASLHCPNLRRLNLGYTSVDDEALMSLAATCASLHMLSLAGCLCITDAGVVELCSKNRDMRELILAMNHQLSDKAIGNLLVPLKRLETLDLSGTNAGAQTSKALYANNFNLKEFAIANVKELDTHHLSTMVQRCPKLSFLDVTGCSSLTSSIFTQLETMKSLKRFHCSYCPDLTVESMDG